MNEAEKTRESWQERKMKIKNKWYVPFVYLEWKCEQLSALLERLAFLDILGYAGRLTILVAVIFYFAETDSRRKAKHYQAWQVINTAQGKQHSGGRIDALKDLNKDGVSLASIDIHNANLRGINLEHANLRYANLSDAHLYEANLSGAYLYAANLSRAFLYAANLSEVDFFAANLYGAYLCNSNLSNIKNWQNIKSIKLANIYDVKEPPEGFVEWAIKHGAIRIVDGEKWKELLRLDMEEKKKQEAGNNRAD